MTLTTKTRDIAAAVLAIGLAFGISAAALAETPAKAAAPAKPAASEDALTDPSLKGAEVIAFMGLKRGDKVADIVGGRFVRALSQAVGPTGKVYVVEPAEVVKLHPEIMGMLKDIGTNVVTSTPPVDAPALPSGLDAVFIRQNYHDLHDKFMGPADVALFNRNVFAALKPGGAYIVLDHADAPGAGLKNTDTLHRIDIASVKSEVAAAGFVLDAESKILANPADDHTKNVFDPAVRGKTDQFLLKFHKPT